MGVLYNGNYLKLFEYGRTELMRLSGLSYKEFEKMGYLLPVARANIEFKKPVFYDEPCEIETIVKSHDKYKMIFSYNIKDDRGILAKGETVHTVINTDGKLIPIPEILTRILNGEKVR
ncbi:acyl-CoA thioesterase [bacterium]|nr:acyl-CoA thioesterase [bacterium]